MAQISGNRLVGWAYHGWARPAPTRRQVRIDLLVSLLGTVLLVGSVEVWRTANYYDAGWEGVEAYVWAGAAGVALSIRRVAPIVHLLVQSILFVVIGERLSEYSVMFTVQAAMFAALYAAWAWSRRPRALIAATVIVLIGMFGWLFWALRTQGELPVQESGRLLDAATAALVYITALNIAYFAGAIAWGHVAWRSARERVELAARREVEVQHLRADQDRALRDERIRIARELHDVVAHHVSGIGVQAAGAARVRDPEQVARSLATIEASSRQAVTSMHQLVGLLRAADETDLAPQPGLADLAGLEGEMPTVRHQVVGDPFDVPGTVGQSLFRIAQEAVTNLRRHARARHATVVLRYVASDPHHVPDRAVEIDLDPHHVPDRAVEIEVTDDGSSTPHHAPQRDGSGGFGLIGIRERAAMLGGEAEIGPRPTGGFRVRVRVPVPDADPGGTAHDE